MCGRFSLTSKPAEVATLLRLPNIPDLAPRYNVAPSQPVSVVRERESGRELVPMVWGLVPHWMKGPKPSAFINARAETAPEKPAFRDAFRYRRCLIPADGFYEWSGKEAKRQPYHFRLRSHEPFALAGLFDIWHDGSGGAVDTCCILTTQANELVAPLHERMPVILNPDEFDRWLAPSIQRPETLLPLLKPYPAEAMEGVTVSTLVNSPRNEGPELLEATSD